MAQLSYDWETLNNLVGYFENLGTPLVATTEVFPGVVTSQDKCIWVIVEHTFGSLGIL